MYSWKELIERFETIDESRLNISYQWGDEGTNITLADYGTGIKEDFSSYSKIAGRKLRELIKVEEIDEIENWRNLSDETLWYRSLKNTKFFTFGNHAWTESDDGEKLNIFTGKIRNPIQASRFLCTELMLFSNRKAKNKKRVKNFNIYVDPDRIKSLTKVNTDEYDLTKVIDICNEMNLAIENEAWYSLAALNRALIDHIPPIFGLSSFTEVANNYNWSKSEKELMQHLDVDVRDISDNLLHKQISNNRNRPTQVQVDKSHVIDILIEAIINKLTT